MKWFFIFKFIPIPVFYTHKMLSPHQGGRSLGIFAIIRPTEKEYKSIHAHELEHCRQFYITTSMWILGTSMWTFIDASEITIGYLYALAPSAYFIFRRFIPLYRYDMEIAAYKRALESMSSLYVDSYRKTFVVAITANYNINTNKYTLSRAMKDLL